MAEATASEVPSPELKRVCELRTQGNTALQASQYEEAIEHYTAALRSARHASQLVGSAGAEALKEEEAGIYSNRSAAFASLSRRYLSRPASRSEASALYGLDPRHLASLALSDAQKCVALRPDWPEAHLRLGSSLFLSEQYPEAEAAYLQGLSLDPSNRELQEGLKEVARVLHADSDDKEEEDDGKQDALQNDLGAAGPSGSGGGSGGGEGGSADAIPLSPGSGGKEEGGSGSGSRGLQRDSLARNSSKRPRLQRSLNLNEGVGAILECTLCLKLLFEPVTTACGHSFCRTCLSRALDHTPRCPMCRTILHHTTTQLPSTVTLANLLEHSFPQEYKARAEEEAAAVAAASGVRQQEGDIIPALPLFVMSNLFPGETMALNIFEPRYRLLIRRAMEGDRRLGMACMKPDRSSLDPLATEAEILECTAQPDGRYAIEVVGRRRVEILSHSELDGYRIARCRPFQDSGPAPGSEQAGALPGLIQEVTTQLEGMLGRLRAWGTATGGLRGGRVLQFLEQAGPRPPLDKAELVSFWAGALAISFLPDLDYGDRARLLEMKDTHERIQFVKDHMERAPYRAEGGPGCCVM